MFFNIITQKIIAFNTILVASRVNGVCFQMFYGKIYRIVRSYLCVLFFLCIFENLSSGFLVFF